MNDYSIPRLKPFVEFCSINSKILFFKRPSIAIQLDDASDFIATTCRLMNGKWNIKQLKQKLLPSFPKEAHYLKDLLAVLDKEFLLEDVTQNYATNLTEYDIARWSRNVEFFGAYCRAGENKYFYQEKLKSVKVALLGLGGVGSHVLYNLAAMGVQNITIVDFDEVELSNLNRQILYNESDIGQLKTKVAKNRILEFLPKVNIEVINKKISSSADIEQIVHEQDIVISAVDQPREQIIDWLNIACTKCNIPFICGALDSSVAIYYSVIPGKTGCIECWKTYAKKSNFIFQELIQQEGFVSSTTPNITIMPFISIVSGLIANEFLKIITNITEPQSLGRLCTFDFSSAQINIQENWQKNPTCQICRLD